MTAGPAKSLQSGVFSAIRANAAAAALLGGSGAALRVYDLVPTSPRFPYVVIGDDQIIDDSHCEAAFEAFATVHVFSRPTGEGLKGKTEAKAIADTLVDALSVALDLGDAFVCSHDDADPPFQDMRVFYEPDGLTAHAVLVFRYLIDQSVT